MRCNRNLRRAKFASKVIKTAEIIRFPLFSGANDVTRTHDLLITNQLLYRLSYISIFTFGVADLILTNQLLYVSIGNDEII